MEPVLDKARKGILIIRLSAIGDVIMASPLIRAFRRTWPEMRISWLVEEASKPVLEANNDLDEIIVWEREKWRLLLREKRYLTLVKLVFSFIRSLRNKRFDVAVDAQGLLKSGIWAFLSGARERIGIGSKEGSKYLMTRVVERSGASDRISSQYLLLAEEMGLDTDDFDMVMALSPKALQYAENFSSSLVSSYVVLCPFTTRPQKHWIEDRWVDLIGRILERTQLTIVLLGGPADRAVSGEILPEGRSRIVNLAGETSVQQAGAVIANAALLIGVDTGLTHMGIALGTPTIALFGATRPYLDTDGTSGTVLYHPMECSPCRRTPTCDDRFTCMEAITTDEVFSKAIAVLEKR
jgi:heptosyltransferase-1